MRIFFEMDSLRSLERKHVSAPSMHSAGLRGHGLAIIFIGFKLHLQIHNATDQDLSLLGHRVSAWTFKSRHWTKRDSTDFIKSWCQDPNFGDTCLSKHIHQPKKRPTKTHSKWHPVLRSKPLAVDTRTAVGYPLLRQSFWEKLWNFLRLWDEISAGSVWKSGRCRAHDAWHLSPPSDW